MESCRVGVAKKQARISILSSDGHDILPHLACILGFHGSPSSLTAHTTLAQGFGADASEFASHDEVQRPSFVAVFCNIICIPSVIHSQSWVQSAFLMLVSP
jgi:hypothetical protein